jgi:hypothetical protein
MVGNTSDQTTLRGFLKRIEGLHGKAQRVWVMDRGIPTEGGASPRKGVGDALSLVQTFLVQPLIFEHFPLRPFPVTKVGSR